MLWGEVGESGGISECVEKKIQADALLVLITEGKSSRLFLLRVM